MKQTAVCRLQKEIIEVAGYFFTLLKSSEKMAGFTLSGVPPGENSVTVMIGLDMMLDFFLVAEADAAAAAACLAVITEVLWTDGVDTLRRP